MGTNICEHVVGKLGNSLSVKLDESTDVTGNTQLIALVIYMDTDEIYDHVLFFKSLEAKTEGEDTFNVVNSFFCFFFL